MSNSIRWTYRTIIVPQQYVDFARELTASIAGSSGQGMFTTPLAGSQDATVTTHWISAGLILEEFAKLLPLKEFTEEGILIISEGNADVVTYAANQAGLQINLEQVKEMFSLSYVSEQDAFFCMDAVGLEMKQESNENSQQ